MLLALCKLARETHSEMIALGVDAERAKAIATYLGLLIDRMADYHSTLCACTTSREDRSHVRAAGTAHDVGLLRGESIRRLIRANLWMHLEGIAKVIEHCGATGRPVQVLRERPLSCRLRMRHRTL